jgi:hypothetical protein
LVVAGRRVVGAAVVAAWTVVAGTSEVTIEVTVTVRTSCDGLAPALPTRAPATNAARAITQVRRHHGGSSDGGGGGGGSPHGRCGGCSGGGPQPPGWVGWSLMSPPVQLGESGTYMN